MWNIRQRSHFSVERTKPSRWATYSYFITIYRSGSTYVRSFIPSGNETVKYFTSGHESFWFVHLSKGEVLSLKRLKISFWKSNYSSWFKNLLREKYFIGIIGLKKKKHVQTNSFNSSFEIILYLNTIRCNAVHYGAMQRIALNPLLKLCLSYFEEFSSL